MPSENFLTTKEASEYFDVPMGTLSCWKFKNPDFPCVKTGQTVYILKREFAAWLKRYNDRKNGTLPPETASEIIANPDSAPASIPAPTPQKPSPIGLAATISRIVADLEALPGINAAIENRLAAIEAKMDRLLTIWSE